MIRVAPVIAQQLGSGAIVADENIEIAVVVEVSNGRATADFWRNEVRSELIANVLENSSAVVSEHKLWLGIVRVGVIALNVVEHVAIRHKEVARAVVVIVKEARAETAHVKGCVAELRAKGRVRPWASPRS